MTNLTQQHAIIGLLFEQNLLAQQEAERLTAENESLRASLDKRSTKPDSEGDQDA